VQYVCHYDAVICGDAFTYFLHIFNSLAKPWPTDTSEPWSSVSKFGEWDAFRASSASWIATRPWIQCIEKHKETQSDNTLKQLMNFFESLLLKKVYCVMLRHVVCHMEFIFASAATETGAPTLQLVQHILPNKVKALVQDGPSSFLMMSRYIKALNPNESDWTCTSKAIM
jgi:hypothetical protein